MTLIISVHNIYILNSFQYIASFKLFITAHQWGPLLYSSGEGMNVEVSATNSLGRVQTYSLMCIDCHGLEGLFRFKYYHEPDERIE